MWNALSYMGDIINGMNSNTDLIVLLSLLLINIFYLILFF